MDIATLNLTDLTDQDIALCASRFATEAEKRKIAAYQQNQEKAWKKKKKLATMVRTVLGEDCVLTVWEKDGDQRVYIEDSPRDQRFRNVEVAYYVTGNGRYPPRHLMCKFTRHFAGVSDERKAWRVEAKRLVLQICQMAARTYVRLDRLDCDMAAVADVEIDPLPAEFIAFGAWAPEAAPWRCEDIILPRTAGEPPAGAIWMVSRSAVYEAQAYHPYRYLSQDSSLFV